MEISDKRKQVKRTMTNTPRQPQKTRLDRLQVAIACLIGIGTIGVALWRFTEWTHRVTEVVGKTETTSLEIARLKDEVARLKEFVSRQSEVSHPIPLNAKVSTTTFTAEQLTGTWDLTFRGSGAKGRLGATSAGSNLIEFHGELPQGKNPPLKLVGHGAFEGRHLHVSFDTRSEGGEHWYGRGEFSIDSLESLRGWYVDQYERFDTIDVKRLR
jgi:hypothetical protein